MNIRLLIVTLFAASLFGADVKPPDTHWIDDLGGHVVRDAQNRVTGVILRGTWVGDADPSSFRASFPT